MQQEEQKKVVTYTALQNQQHKKIYSLETSTSLKILRSIQKRSTFANVCEDNLSNLNKVIDRKQMDIYVKEKPNNSRTGQNFLQLMISHLQNRIQVLQEPLQDDSSEDWQPDEQNEDDNSQ
ncbi:unnamed protein product [Paramecium sonneborni]|uniref:Uncharacterized protein n=1 Tax=Paramecium sonneborni TaxID=65129 RepID=A0A8S1KT44_9CILI|nr:unnamed protein product [Paramecium sonneborni]